MAESLFILEIEFLHIRGGCSLVLVFFVLVLVGTCCFILSAIKNNFKDLIYFWRTLQVTFKVSLFHNFIFDDHLLKSEKFWWSLEISSP